MAGGPLVTYKGQIRHMYTYKQGIFVFSLYLYKDKTKPFRHRLNTSPMPQCNKWVLGRAGFSPLANQK